MRNDDYARWLENEIAMVLTFDRPERDRPGCGDSAAETPAPAGEE